MNEENNQKPNTNATTPIEITDDLITVKVVIAEMLKALNNGRKSRERSLVITKLQEAQMWANEGLKIE